MTRRPTRQIHIGKVGIGSDHPVSVQSMATVPLARGTELIVQLENLSKLGCDIVRVSVDSVAEAALLPDIVRQSPVPLVADIQFCAEAAAAAIRGGAGGVRINPGLFHDQAALAELAALAIDEDVAIRVGANSGSIGKAAVDALVNRGLTPEKALVQALVEGTLRSCEALEKLGVRNLKAALKSSSVPLTIAATRQFAACTDYPLHLGVTEAGTPAAGAVKSAVGIGALLADGIGDTIRVSLTAPPEAEIPVALRILEACQLRPATPEIVSCPTCGRTEIALVELAEKVEKLIAEIKTSGGKIPWRKVAVMGCPVNGPGEAKNADLGLAGSRNGEIVIFRHGKVLGVYPEAEALRRFSSLLIGKIE